MRTSNASTPVAGVTAAPPPQRIGEGDVCNATMVANDIFSIYKEHDIIAIGVHMQWPRLQRQCTHNNPRMMMKHVTKNAVETTKHSHPTRTASNNTT